MGMWSGCENNAESQIKSLKELKQYINLKLLLDRKNRKTDGWRFVHTHEITITHVPLNYIKAILVHQSNFEMVKFLIEQFDLDIKIDIFKQLFESILK